MGFFDKIMNTFSLDDADDGFYDEVDDDFIDEEEEENEQRSFFSKKSKKEEEPPRKSKITPMRSSKRNRGDENGGEIEMFKPTSDVDVCDIIDALLADRTVMLNLEGINENLAEKVINTVSGATYALSGNMVKFSSFIFIIAPKSVVISGDSGNESNRPAPQQSRPYEFARAVGGRF